MRSNCPNCGVPFELPKNWNEEITCPACKTQFMPVDEREVRAELRATTKSRIEEVFARLADDPKAKSVLAELVTDTPIPGRGGYLQRERDIESLIAVSRGRLDLISAIVQAMAIVEDWFFCHKILGSEQISAEAEQFVAQSTMGAKHLGGQSGDYFKLLSVLVGRRDDVRRWCETIRQNEGRQTILAENMELVLTGRV